MNVSPVTKEAGEDEGEDETVAEEKCSVLEMYYTWSKSRWILLRKEKQITSDLHDEAWTVSLSHSLAFLPLRQ